jgi:predicted NBD/HSP70 family sugar kinase
VPSQHLLRPADALRDGQVSRPKREVVGSKWSVEAETKDLQQPEYRLFLSDICQNRSVTQAPSRLPPLRLSTPPLAGRSDPGTTLSAVARLVASGVAVSKADLVPVTGMARSTVSAAVDQLLSRGVLQRAGTRPTAGRGRPADRLELSPSGGQILIADVGASGMHLAVVDLSQRLVAYEHVEQDVRDGPDATIAVVEQRLAALAEKAPDRVAVRAVVIGLPGPVDGQRGTPVRPPIMPGWHAYPVADRLRSRFEVPVILENDANLRALGEARAMAPDQVPLLYVKIGTGVGGGLVTSEGVLHRGPDGAAGDIGHIRVRGPGDPCACGNVGCIEAVASAGAIRRRLDELAPDQAPVTMADIRERLAAGDPTVHRLVRESAVLIGELVAMLVHFYNPARVTLGGSLTEVSDELLAGVRSVVYQRALPLATRNLVLTHSVLGDHAGLAGAAVLGIEHVLSATEIDALTS